MNHRIERAVFVGGGRHRLHTGDAIEVAVHHTPYLIDNLGDLTGEPLRVAGVNHHIVTIVDKLTGGQQPHATRRTSNKNQGHSNHTFISRSGVAPQCTRPHTKRVAIVQ